MDTGRGDVDKFWTGAGDGQQSRRQMLRDCLERHGGDSLVAGQVADILEGLVLQGDSGESSLVSVARKMEMGGGCWGAEGGPSIVRGVVYRSSMILACCQQRCRLGRRGYFVTNIGM